jgi:hypothetical protein
MTRRHAILFALLAMGGLGRSTLASAACLVAASVSPAASRILPGEPVDLNLTVRNATTSPISLFRPSELVGNVRLAIAQSANPVYRDYLGPGWGIKDVRRTPVTLNQNAALSLRLRVLNHTVIAQANPDPAAQILTAFALPDPGTFLLKVSYSDRASCPRSAPAEATATVQVVAPTGKDLAFWNAIKDCARCAYFLHTGDAGASQADQAALALLRNLTKQYPSSRYARLVRKALHAGDDDRDDDRGHDRH